MLARHAPLLARLKPGLVRVVREPDYDESFFVSGGFLEVHPQAVTVLADTVLRGRELDESAARAAKQRTEQALKAAPSPADYARLKAELNWRSRCCGASTSCARASACADSLANSAGGSLLFQSRKFCA